MSAVIWRKSKKISANVIKAAEDAVMLDSSELNIDEVVEAIYEYAKKAGLEA